MSYQLIKKQIEKKGYEVDICNKAVVISIPFISLKRVHYFCSTKLDNNTIEKELNKFLKNLI